MASNQQHGLEDSMPYVLPDDWHAPPLGAECVFVRDGDWIETKDQGGKDFRLLQVSNIGHGSFRETGNFRYVTADTFERLNCTEIELGDVLVARMPEPTGRAWWVDQLPERAITAVDVAIIRTDSSKLDSRFLSYYLNTRECLSIVESLTQGSTRRRVRRADIERLRVPRPPLPEQRAIAAILGTLDDKIQQNQRTARTLERLARAIFRAWFVDFEAVKAKAAGETAFPSMPQPVFDVLPTRFVDSDIGSVPHGWEVKGIGDVVTAKGGGTPSTKNPDYWNDGEHCWATPKDMSRLSHPVLLDTERHITDAGVSSISSGILPVGTVLMSSRAPVGYLAIAGVPTAINQGFIAMVCDGPLPPTYVLNWAFTSMDTIKAHASGTTFPEISKKNFRPLPIVVPTSDVIGAYQQMADPLYELLTASMKEAERLARVRDYLLPQLLSGAVRVRA